jgi:hypothetical protein
LTKLFQINKDNEIIQNIIFDRYRIKYHSGLSKYSKKIQWLTKDIENRVTNKYIENLINIR